MEHGAAGERHADGVGGAEEEGKNNEHGKVPHCDSAEDKDETGVALDIKSTEPIMYCTSRRIILRFHLVVKRIIKHGECDAKSRYRLG